MEKTTASITIRMNEIKDLAQNLADFLRERVGLDVSVQGDTLILNKGSGDKEFNRGRLKVYLKKFLHREGLRRKYRILVKSGELNFVKMKEEVES